MSIFSPGQHFRLVPKSIPENLKFRLSILDECFDSAQTRTRIMQACGEDIIFWIDTFGWQTNPNMLDEEDGPFICTPFQEEVLAFTIDRLFRHRRVVLWEKSRMQGGTMLALFLDLWMILFHSRKRSLIMSHNEKAVEKSGDEDTLFGKLEFILEHLPSWMRAGCSRNRGVWRNERTRSQITGQSTTIRSGVGGRVTKLTLDEFSKYQNADAILGQTRDTGPPLIIGTHYGVGGTFHDLTKRPDISKVVMHWSKNPFHNRGLYRSDPGLLPEERIVDQNNASPLDYPFVTDGSPHGGPFPGLRSIYYDQVVCKDRNPREVAIHWDIDPEGAGRQFFDASMVHDLVKRYATEPIWQGEVEYKPTGAFTRLTTLKDGPLKVWVPFLANHEHSGRWFAPSLYKVGCDVSQGVGATPSCLSAIDALTGRKILEYRFAWINPETFASLAVALCQVLTEPGGNPAQLIWDGTGGVGEKFGQTVREIGFTNVWYWRDEFKLNQKVSDKAGWFSGPNAKLSLLRDYERALRMGHVTNPSESALKECLAFEYASNGDIVHGEAVRTEDPAAGKLNHADMVIADALAWKLCRDIGAERPAEEKAAILGYEPYTFGWLAQQQELAEEKDPFRY